MENLECELCDSIFLPGGLTPVCNLCWHKMADERNRYKAALEEIKAHDCCDGQTKKPCAAKIAANALRDTNVPCVHKWAHIEDHHVICEKCKHVADLCWPHENEKPCEKCAKGS